VGKMNVGFLASGRGSNFKAIADHVRLKVLKDVDLRIVVSNNEKAKVLELAKDYGVDSVVFPYDKANREDFERKAIDEMEKYGVELVVLAGFDRILTPLFIRHYKWRSINIHPSILPAFPGLNAQEQAWKYGVRFSGCTIHYVTEGVDVGPIIVQEVVGVKWADTAETLADRILVYEHRMFPRAVQMIADKIVEPPEPGDRKVKMVLTGEEWVEWEKEWDKRQEKYVVFQEEEWEKAGKPLKSFL